MKLSTNFILRISFSISLGLLLPLNGEAKETESICYGTPAQGSLKNGKLLPRKGKNFSTYSLTGSLMGRTAVHSQVRDIVLQTYQDLYAKLPEKKYVYGETGWGEGGSFKPHKTHQNGLSVDFMVPIVDKNGKSIALPTHALNKWGYAIEFDSLGKFKNYAIDFEALSAHLFYLHKNAVSKGVAVRRVIFDPKLRPQLYKTSHWPYLEKNLKFSKQSSWVRHDEHYHVDFDLPCGKK